jgi:hypothetical protein
MHDIITFVYKEDNRDARVFTRIVAGSTECFFVS